MNIIESIQSRRAVKHYDPDHRMGDEEIKQLMELAMRSPTAFNIQNWRFVLVRDPDLRKEVRAIAWDQAQVTDASLFVVICGDKKAWEKDPARYWRNAPQEVQDFLVPAIGNFYSGNETAQRDEVMRSAGIAAQTLMLAARGMGLNSCPMTGFDFDAIAKLINLPDDHMVAMAVAIGKEIDPPPWPHAGDIPYEEAVKVDRF